MNDIPAAFRIVVPGAPRGVERARSRIVTTKKGQQFVAAYTPAKTRLAAAVIKDFAEQAMAGRAPFDGPLELRYVAYLPIPQSFSKAKTAAALSGALLPTVKPDFDNIAKFVDGLNHVVFRDDAQIAKATIWKFYSDKPRIVVEIRPAIAAALRLVA